MLFLYVSLLQRKPSSSHSREHNVCYMYTVAISCAFIFCTINIHIPYTYIWHKSKSMHHLLCVFWKDKQFHLNVFGFYWGYSPRLLPRPEETPEERQARKDGSTFKMPNCGGCFVVQNLKKIIVNLVSQVGFCLSMDFSGSCKGW